MNNREIICIHVGQAGIQIGSAVWELFSIEHELDDSGYQICYCPWPLMDNTNSLYLEKSDGKYKPRSLMVDSEPLVVEEIRTGIWNKMFDSRSLISGKEDASTIFARGYNVCANDVLNDSVTYLRILLEESSSLNGILLFHSLGGGTGSGLTSRLAETIQTEAPKKPMIHLSIVPPTNKSGFIVEPYNGVLSTAALLESSSLMCMMENQSLYEAVNYSINKNKLSFININRYIGQITSSLTTSYRFANKLSSDFCVFQTNLVPFPEIHFPIVSYAQSYDSSDINLIHMTKLCFSKEKMVLKLDPELGSFMSCCLLYRGMNCSPMAVNNAIKQIKSNSTIKFVDWSPTSFKVAINVEMPGYVPCADIPETKQSLCLLSNSTAILQQWMKLLENFQNLFSRKAFLHWFESEGVDESILKEAEDRIIDLISKYNDLSTDKDLSYLSNHKPNRDVPQYLKRIHDNQQGTCKDPTNANTKKPPIGSESPRISQNQGNRYRESLFEADSVDEVTTSYKQFNLSSKFKQSQPKQYLLKTLPDPNTDRDSSVDSMFIKYNSYQSLETINSLQGSILSVSSKLEKKPFSTILYQSIMDLRHLVNDKKLSSLNSSLTSKDFLSQFCRLNSLSQETICNIKNHSCQLNYSIGSIKHDSVSYAHMKEDLSLFDEATDFVEREYFLSEKTDCFTTSDLFKVSIFQSQILESVKINQSNKTLNDCQNFLSVSQIIRSEIACQTNEKLSLTNKISQMLRRRSLLNRPKKPKETIQRRHSLQKNSTPEGPLMASSKKDLRNILRSTSLHK